ncbi:AI-2E family transporter [Falsiroseomonas sp. E2-1-a20]|uniref:AI-2E family transporter n=1 Tax=Falsiroseomonas sp. E2-1-a20 TaxID=3239300 RepID=UPI003F3E496D
MIGRPSPLALGLFAGLVGFVPLRGGVAGAVPPLLLALATGGDALLWTAVPFLAIQQLESNMILPLAEKHMLSMPRSHQPARPSRQSVWPARRTVYCRWHNKTGTAIDMPSGRLWTAMAMASGPPTTGSSSVAKKVAIPSGRLCAETAAAARRPTRPTGGDIGMRVCDDPIENGQNCDAAEQG